MGSLYNMLHGQDPLTPLFLAVLGIDQEREEIPWPKNEDGKDWDPGFDDETSTITIIFSLSSELLFY